MINDNFNDNFTLDIDCQACGHKMSEHGAQSRKCTKSDCICSRFASTINPNSVRATMGLPEYTEDGILGPEMVKAVKAHIGVTHDLYGYELEHDAMGRPYPKPDNKRKEILETAESLINGDRADTYGPPELSFGRIGDLWTAMGMMMLVPSADGKTGHYRDINAVDVALALTQIKVARIIGQPDHNDSWIDAAGYIALGGEIALGNDDNKKR